MSLSIEYIQLEFLYQDRHMSSIIKSGKTFTLYFLLRKLGSVVGPVIQANEWLTHLGMTWGQEVCYVSLDSRPASALSLPTKWSLWGSLGMANCWDMLTLPAGYISPTSYMYLIGILSLFCSHCLLTSQTNDTAFGAGTNWGHVDTVHTKFWQPPSAYSDQGGRLCPRYLIYWCQRTM